MTLIHTKKPNRREIDQRNLYKLYRKEIREDFNNSCGYCDDSDQFLDRICFHIDHFAPQDKFPELKTSYKNLIYSCRFCNIKKSNHWISDNPDMGHDNTSGFVDPCTDEYDKHLSRDENGRIIGETPVGQYMVRHLNLNLLRHQLLWRARRARKLRNEIKALLELNEAAGYKQDQSQFELLQRFVELTTDIDNYETLAADG